MLVRLLLILLIAGLSGEPLRADPAPRAVTAYFENDGTYLKRNNAKDGHYTSGQMLLLSHEPDWADRLAAWLPDADAFAATRTGAGYFVGQQIFTPDDTRPSAVIPDDRPYAGYLFTGAYWQRAHRHVLDHLQLEIGTVGEGALGENAQNWIHGLIHEERAHGWDHQIDGEVTFQLTARRKWRIPLARQDAWGVDFIPGLGVGLGTVKRQVEAAGTLRAGWRLPDDFGPTRIDDLAGGPAARQAGVSFYVYGRLAGRAVLHNTFIDGPDFGEDPLTRVDRDPLVGELEAGFSLRYRRDRWAVDLGYAQVFNTGEFRQQSGGDEWAAVRLSVICGF